MTIYFWSDVWHACIKSKINGHNKKILQPKPAEPQKLCNCLVKEDLPLNGLCLTWSILYQSTIKCSNFKYKQKRYKEICKMTFKKCYGSYENALMPFYYALILWSLHSLLNTHCFIGTSNVPKCMSCHKVIVVITRRAHCFHDCLYITSILVL